MSPMASHVSNEGTPRTDAELDRLLVPGDVMATVVNKLASFARTLERENQSLARRVGELEARERCLRRAVETASIQLQTAGRRIADSGNASLGELVLGWSQAARTTLNQGDKAS